MKVREIIRKEQELKNKMDEIYSQCMKLELANPYWNKLEQAIRDWFDFINTDLNSSALEE